MATSESPAELPRPISVPPVDPNASRTIAGRESTSGTRPSDHAYGTQHDGPASLNGSAHAQEGEMKALLAELLKPHNLSRLLEPENRKLVGQLWRMGLLKLGLRG